MQVASSVFLLVKLILSVFEQIFNFVFVAVTAVATYFGTGRHLVVSVLNQPDLIQTSIRARWIATIWYFPPLLFTKVRTPREGRKQWEIHAHSQEKKGGRFWGGGGAMSARPTASAGDVDEKR